MMSCSLRKLVGTNIMKRSVNHFIKNTKINSPSNLFTRSVIQFRPALIRPRFFSTDSFDYINHVRPLEDLSYFKDDASGRDVDEYPGEGKCGDYLVRGFMIPSGIDNKSVEIFLTPYDKVEIFGGVHSDGTFFHREWQLPQHNNYKRAGIYPHFSDEALYIIVTNYVRKTGRIIQEPAS